MIKSYGKIEAGQALSVLNKNNVYFLTTQLFHLTNIVAATYEAPALSVPKPIISVNIYENMSATGTNMFSKVYFNPNAI